MSIDSGAKEFEKLQSQGEALSDEELKEVAGGRGQFTHSEIVGSALYRVTSCCEMVNNNDMLKVYYVMGSRTCRDYVWNGKGSNDLKCTCCTNFCYDWEVEYIRQI